MATLGERIKELRTSKGLTQRELSEFMGYKTLRSIQLIEANKQTIDHLSVIKLSDFFCVSADYLIGKSDPQKSTSDKKYDPFEQEILVDLFSNNEFNLKGTFSRSICGEENVEFVLYDSTGYVGRFDEFNVAVKEYVKLVSEHTHQFKQISASVTNSLRKGLRELIDAQ